MYLSDIYIQLIVAQFRCGTIYNFTVAKQNPTLAAGIWPHPFGFVRNMSIEQICRYFSLHGFPPAGALSMGSMKKI